jgi:hypothetical protein
MVEYLTAEMILTGILGIACLCTIVVVFYIIRNYRLIEKQNEKLSASNKRMLEILELIAKENEK